MMREIKFRMWNSCGDKSRMFTDIEQVMRCLEQQLIYNQSCVAPLGYDHVGQGNAFIQFTGQTDKNGSDVYEGDILEWNDVDNHIRYVCEYDTKYPRFLFRQIINRNRPNLDKPSSGFSQSAEVIGNIYKNPELLNP